MSFRALKCALIAKLNDESMNYAVFNELSLTHLFVLLLSAVIIDFSRIIINVLFIVKYVHLNFKFASHQVTTGVVKGIFAWSTVLIPAL